jgi:hypothetical protein
MTGGVALKLSFTGSRRIASELATLCRRGERAAGIVARQPPSPRSIAHFIPVHRDRLLLPVWLRREIPSTSNRMSEAGVSAPPD